ncbi:MAG TPA: hypothetical protein P5248_05075, partial [Bacteroidales bacterium]|nr:hypothetical protein [Bacteroidales bacterium]
MEKVVHNVFRVITTILMALAVLLVAIIWAKGDTVMANDPNLQDKILNPFSWMTYIAIGIALVLVFVFPIYQIIDNPRNAMRAVLAIGLLVAIGLIS